MATLKMSDDRFRKLVEQAVVAAHIAGLKEALEIAENAPPWALPGAIHRIRSRIEELEKKTNG